MANNTLPIALKTPRIQRGDATLTSQNTALDGTGTSVIAFTANATNSSICHYLIFTPTSLSATSNTCARIFVNDGAGTAAANNTFIKQINLPVTTLSATAALNEIVAMLNLPLPANYKILVTLGTASAQGWQVTGVGGDC